MSKVKVADIKKLIKGMPDDMWLDFPPTEDLEKQDFRDALELCRDLIANALNGTPPRLDPNDHQPADR